MRNYILLFCIAFMFACQAQQNPPADTAKATPVTTKPENNLVKKDTTPKPVKRRNYMVDRSRPKPEIDHQFPFDIALKTVDEEVVNSADILKSNGKPTVLLFWLTTCYPCRIEMAAIEKEMPNWQKEADFNIVAISTDFEKNYPKFVERVKKENWSFAAYNDVNREFRKVLPGELNGLPQTFVFDKDGNIAYHKRKYVSGDEHKLFAKVKELAR